MRSVFVMAVGLALAGFVLAGCGRYGVQDWGDRPAADAPATKVGPGEKLVVRTTPGTDREVWSVLLLLDAPQGAVVGYEGEYPESELVTTGERPNYVHVQAPGGVGVSVTNPSGPVVSATFVAEWQEYLD